MASPDHQRPPHFALAAGGLACAGAATVLLGWLTGFLWPVRPLPGAPGMGPITALGLLACGGGVVALARRRDRLALALGGTAAGLGLVVLLGFAVPLGGHLDRLLVPPWSLPAGAPLPGRTSPYSTLALLLLGGAITIAASAASVAGHRARETAAAGLASGTTAVGAAALLGHLAGTALPALRGTNLAPHSAALILVAGAGALLTVYHRSGGRGGALATVRTLWPPLAVAAIVFGGTAWLGRASAGENADATLHLARQAIALIGVLLACVVGVTAQVAHTSGRRARLLAQAAAEVESASRAKDHFLATLSHELRTPLTPVLTLAESLEADPALDPRTRDAAAVIRRNVQLEARLIDDLLDLTRVSRGKLDLCFETVDAHEKLRQVLAICAPDAAAKRLDVALDAAAAHRHVQADAARLQQVLWNLVKNAIKFTPPGGRVAVRTRDAPGGRLVVEVQDSGVGIRPELLPRIFDPFEQGGENVTRAFGGLGLGLAIARRLVDAHGGTLAAASEGPGRGATFTLSLPAAPAPSAKPAPADAAPTPAPRGLRILLVEDHPDTARALAHVLERDGHAVQTAHSVSAALDTAAAAHFDLVVSDIGLPDASGYDLMRRLADRRDGRPIPGIALSGYGMEDDVRKSRAAGFSEHLLKPVNLKQLAEAVRRVAPRPA